ncbi:MAG: SDR family NAD(P)-dependent oxidoreductase [Bacteroidota bacterium]
MRTVFITGATSGIGEATARNFAADGNRLIICGRRKDRLETLATQLRNEFGIDILPLVFDISSLAETRDAIENVPDSWKEVDVLINNAGLAAGLNLLHEGEIDDWERMIDTNIKGLLYVTRLIAPGMIARRRGHIINLGSIAGREVYARGNVYCATKHAVDGLTQAMRIDFVPFGIKVTQVAPGAVETEFALVRLNGDAVAAQKIYAGYEPLHAHDIAGIILYIANLPAHVNVNDILITPVAQANNHNFFKNGI